MILNTDASLLQLVSYPRTGSHWFRVVMEQYLGRPCLPDSFFNNSLENPWAYHLHDRIVGKGDEGLTSGFDKIIYLYRNPVDTIFSMCQYERTDDYHKICLEYKRHLERWLHGADDCGDVLYVNYDRLRTNTVDVFSNVLSYMSESINESKLLFCISNTTKSLVKSLTKHDDQIVNGKIFDGSYTVIKEKFISSYGKEIEKMFDGVYDEFKSI